MEIKLLIAVMCPWPTRANPRVKVLELLSRTDSQVQEGEFWKGYNRNYHANDCLGNLLSEGNGNKRLGGGGGIKACAWETRRFFESQELRVSPHWISLNGVCHFFQKRTIYMVYKNYKNQQPFHQSPTNILADVKPLSPLL